MPLRKLIVAVHAACALVLVILLGGACVAGTEESVGRRGAAEVAVEGPAGVPVSLTGPAARLRALQLQGGPSYALETRSSSEAFAVGRSAAQRLGLRFLADSVEIQLEDVDGEPWVALQLVAISRGEEWMHAPPTTRMPDVDGAEVRYVRGEALTEWYLNGPQGLEQGFDLEERPAADDMGELSLTIAVRGSLEAQRRGRTIALVDARGVVRARYGKLFVSDAEAQTVPSRLDVDGAGAIVLRIDDALARYPLSVDPLLWAEQQGLTGDGNVVPPDKHYDMFGHSVGLFGDTAIVGAPTEDIGDIVEAGAAYVFVRSGDVWTRQQKLIANDAEPPWGQWLGSSVSLFDDTAILGTRWTGSAYVFVRSGTTWSQQAKLTPEDGDGQFRSVSVSDDTCLVGADASAYVFVRSGNTWAQQQKLVGNGEAVSLSGDTALVGSSVFVRAGTTWAHQADLGGDGGLLSVSVDGDTAVLGKTHGTYVFVRSGQAWTLQDALDPSDGADYVNGEFGHSVSVVGDMAIVGAPDNYTGSAYVFVRSGTTWVELQTLTPADGISRIGTSVSLSDDAVLVGAPDSYLAPHPADENGVAYAFALGVEVGQTCAENSDCPTEFCIDGVCCDNVCGGNNPTDCQACTAALTGGIDGVCAPSAEGTICRGTEVCNPARCDGVEAECPRDGQRMPDGSSCEDGDSCTADDMCVSGVCQPGENVCDMDGAGGSDGGGGTSGAGPDVKLEAGGSGCSCRTTGAPSRSPSPLLWFGLLAMVAAMRRQSGGVGCTPPGP